ncbi:MAG TPA: glycosyltransferase family 2 protein [Burkholderiaceae bacterium]|jgi:N-acetylglucosaminyl-diphospho-decaprenol L-rhamnosyltransferase|nr:glycosyltransferase family 2 protein [Burkholderiaceae bacterium]
MSRPAEMITAISVTFESEALTGSLAATLRLFQHVVVVDNASQDGTADTLTKLLPQAQIIRNAINKGFGSANNQGVALVGTRYALLLNPDCEIQPEALAALLDTAERYPQAAIIAPQGWRSKETVQPSYRQAFYEHRSKQVYRIPDGTCSAKWLHGCCLLIRVAAFREFGGFDEDFFLYYEDDDLCLRALQAGYDCLLEPQAKVLHVGGASSAPSWRGDFFKQFHFFRSRRLIIGKYLGKAAAWRYSMKTALAAPLAVILYAILLRRKHALKWLAWGCSSWLRPFR